MDSPDCDDIFYFGPSQQGLSLEGRCLLAGKKPIIELNGNDGVVVGRDAEIELAARALTECFYGSGQICMTPKFAIVHPQIAEQLLTSLAELTRQIRPGLPEDTDTVLSPVVKRADFSAVLSEALADGGHLVAGGALIDLEGRKDPAGPFVEPTVVRIDGLITAERMRAVYEETFFPLLCVIVPDQDTADEALLDEVIGFLNRDRYGLRNSLWTQDDRVIARFCNEVDFCGMLKVNDSHIGCLPTLPYNGGTGATGGVLGESNQPAVRTTHLQTIVIATRVQPRENVFDHEGPAGRRFETNR
ncbi:aldehyde dehydrogenase family protein [Streptomyces sp. NBC_00237]|uniref:aldehyde dehydrogenase family protein n=1 Tax=Streptomyces sp. NBC_00237 TaxID=2975687 RepID=UPI002258F9A0|nr:aldehyde dehydrogenase family protein [Streptomyces sp. NBC_00237]MCX5205938.1 aldehyde dehydrogenase family protein [Streptomyces sp. NBC_00237]